MYINDLTDDETVLTQLRAQYKVPSYLESIQPWYSSSNNMFGFQLTASDNAIYAIRIDNTNKKIIIQFYNGSTWRDLFEIQGA